MSRKEKLTGIQKAAIVILAIITFSFIERTIDLIARGRWNQLAGQVITLFIIAALIYITRDSFKQLWEGFKEGKNNTREEFEKNKDQVNLKKAAVFALTWSREIYNGIPEDRRPLVKTSFSLIGIGLVIVLIHMSSAGLFVLLSLTLLILAGVNLLIWVVGSEREEKDRIQVELETARRMQLSLMPETDPQVRGFDISGICIPAQNVGGDMFDFVWVGKDSNKLCITVADVSGKGMDAALTAVYTSGAFVSETQHEENVVTVMDNLNSAIYSRQNRSRFVSALIAVLDLSTRCFEYVNAGQSRPLLVRDNSVSVLKAEGSRFPLGVMKTPSYRRQALQLKRGDILLLHTDGVTEAMNAHEEMFGQDRLELLMNELAGKDLGARAMVQELKNRVFRFSGQTDQHDDVTIVIIKAI